MTAAATGELLAFLDDSPTPTHAVAAAARILDEAGFSEGSPESQPNTGYLRRAGSLVAWSIASPSPALSPFRILAAHTDSPGFRVKPDPEHTSAGFIQLGLEVYGGPLLNSWLDRDLGLAGSVLVRSESGPQVRLLLDDRAILRIPQLAIHLDRGVNDQGLKLDRQHHLRPIWALEGDPDLSFGRYVAELVDVAPEDVCGWELMPFDTVPARTGGLADELVISARLDDLVCCHAALRAICDATPTDDTSAVVILVDHEEVGSVSSTGAQSRFVPHVLERLSLVHGASRQDHLGTLESSFIVSADMAHATHPNYPERHDPEHPIRIGGGPVVKHNAQQRYATNLAGMTPFISACADVDVPIQHFVSRSDMPCGSTIGPSLAAGLGIDVVDVGVPQLAMHSIREVCGARDHLDLCRAFARFLTAR